MANNILNEGREVLLKIYEERSVTSGNKHNCCYCDLRRGLRADYFREDSPHHHWYLRRHAHDSPWDHQPGNRDSSH